MKCPPLVKTSKLWKRRAARGTYTRTPESVYEQGPLNRYIRAGRYHRLKTNDCGLPIQWAWD